RQHTELEMFMRRGRDLRHARTPRGELRARTLHRRTVAQTAEHADRCTVERRSCIRNAQRHPVLVVHRETIAFGHHADDRRVRMTELYFPADHRTIATKHALPHIVTDHEDIRAAGLLVGSNRQSAERRLYTRDTKSR